MNPSIRFFPDSHIVMINDSVEYGEIQHAIFDFDGTISLIREGWQSVFIPMMVEILIGTPNHGSDEEIQSTVTEFVDRLTGKLFQICIT